MVAISDMRPPAPAGMGGQDAVVEDEVDPRTRGQRGIGGPNHRPHFHAYHQDDVAIFGIDPVDLIAGKLPRRQRRLVEAWAELLQEELMADWDRLQAGRPPQPIEPLQ
jgi:uncharacterized protein DUF4160